MSADPDNPTPDFSKLDFVYIELTVNCNLRCRFCDNTVRSLYRDLRMEEFTKIVDQLAPGKTIGLHGLGEPTMNKSLVSMISYAKRRRHYVYFSTNHTITTDEQMYGFCEQGLDEIRISLSASTPGSYAAYTGQDLFGKVLELTKQMVKIRATVAKPKISIAFVLTRSNLEDFQPVIRLAEKLGVDEVQLQLYQDWGKPSSRGAPPGGYRFSESEWREAGELLADVAYSAKTVRVVIPRFLEDASRPIWNSEPGQCFWPERAMWITSNGRVAPCFNLHDPRDTRLGLALKESLPDIWGGAKFEKFRKQYRCGEVEACKTCPGHYGAFFTSQIEPGGFD